MLDKWIDYVVILDNDKTLRYKAREWRYAHKVAKTRGARLQKIEMSSGLSFERMLSSWNYRDVLVNEKGVGDVKQTNN